MPNSVRFRRYLLLLFLILSLFCFFRPESVTALENLQKITISPSVEISIKPGQSVSGKVPLINEGSSPVNFTLSVRDITVDNNRGLPRIITSEQLQTISEYIELSEKEVTLNPGERTEITYYIELPSNIIPGGYYASILYETTGEQNNANTEVKSQTGTLMYIVVEGEYFEDAFLKSFELPSFQEYGPISPSFEIQNAGTIHLKPKGAIFVNSLFTEPAIIQIQERNIFPGSALLHEYTYGKKRMIGLYTLTFEAEYGIKSAQKISYQRTILVFPWKEALGALVVGNIILFVSLWIIQGRKKQKQTFSPGKLPSHFPTPKS